MKRSDAFTLLEIMVVVAVIGLLATIALPAFMKNRNTSQQNACINNLRIIDAAKSQWAMNSRKSDGAAAVPVEINEYIRGNTTPICPASGTYSYEIVGSNPVCAGVTATDHVLPPRLP